MLSFIKKVLSIIRCRINIATDIRLKAKYSLKKIMSVIYEYFCKFSKV